MLAVEGMVWRVAWSVRVSCGPRLGRSPRPGRHRDHTPLFREPVRQTACLFFPLPVSPPLSVGTALTGQTRFRGPGRLPGIEFRCAAAEERSRSPFLARPPGTGNVRLSSGSSASTTGICHRRRRRRCLARLIPVEYETITTPPPQPWLHRPRWRLFVRRFRLFRSEQVLLFVGRVVGSEVLWSCSGVHGWLEWLL